MNCSTFMHDAGGKYFMCLFNYLHMLPMCRTPPPPPPPFITMGVIVVYIPPQPLNPYLWLRSFAMELVSYSQPFLYLIICKEVALVLYRMCIHEYFRLVLCWELSSFKTSFIETIPRHPKSLMSSQQSPT